MPTTVILNANSQRAELRQSTKTLDMKAKKAPTINVGTARHKDSLYWTCYLDVNEPQ